jgi:predicted O-methyltransferase YrrM
MSRPARSTPARTADLLGTVMEAAVGLGLPRPMLERTCVSPEDAQLLIETIVRVQPRRILEVGAFVGVSGSLLALAAGPRCHLTCVDPSFPVATEGEPFGYRDDRGALEVFAELAATLGISDRVELVPGYFSRMPDPRTVERPRRNGAHPEAVPIVGARIRPAFDLVFLDGDHYRESVASDLALAVGLLAPGGEMVMHDCAWSWGEEVRAAVATFRTSYPRASFRVEGNLGFLRP